MHVHPLRQMKRSVAFPDKWSKMNVHEANTPFSEETIAYQCEWLAQKIGCPKGFFDDFLMTEYVYVYITYCKVQDVYPREKILE